MAADFIYWLFSSPAGKAFVTNDLKFIAPFDTFAEDEKPTDPLAREVSRYVGNTDLYNVSWNFVKFPSQTFKENFGAALLQYAQGQLPWADVEKLVIEQWKAESGSTLRRFSLRATPPLPRGERGGYAAPFARSRRP